MEVRCSACGGKMVLRKGQYGSFYGCNNYPKCGKTRTIKEQSKAKTSINKGEKDARNKRR